MANWNATGYALTAAGRRIQAKVEAGAVLELTRMKVGSGMESAEEVDALTDLLQPEANVSISAAEVKGETCVITGELLVSTVSHGFWCREWGLFANDPDAGEILYMVALDSEPDWIPADAEVGTAITYVMNVAVANATHVTANIDLTGLVDVDMLQKSTHTILRHTRYQAGNIITAPGLQHGLVLEARNTGVTGDVLLDLSSLSCGDTVQDGEVLWDVRRYVVAPTDDSFYRVEWLYAAIQKLVTVVTDLKRKVMPTYVVTLSEATPDQESAWIVTTPGIGTLMDAEAKVVLEDGTAIQDPEMRVIEDDGTAYYIGREDNSLEDITNLDTLAGIRGLASRSDIDNLVK